MKFERILKEIISNFIGPPSTQISLSRMSRPPLEATELLYSKFTREAPSLLPALVLEGKVQA